MNTEGDTGGIVDVESEARAHVLAGEVGLLAPEQREEHLQVLGHVASGMRVVEAEEVLDDPLMGDTDPERQAAADRVVRGEGLARERHRMAAVRRHDRGPDLDAAGAVRRRGEEREHVRAVRDAGHPCAVVAERFDPLELVADAIDSGTLVRDDHPELHGGGRYQEG